MEKQGDTKQEPNQKNSSVIQVKSAVPKNR